MADNYIERKMEELEARKAMPKKPVSNRAGHKRRVFVTGGASGIGKAIVKAFSNEGYRVAFCDRDAERGKETSKETGALFFRQMSVIKRLWSLVCSNCLTAGAMWMS